MSIFMWGQQPREGTEAHRVQEEIKKRKQIAEDKHVKELICGLYFGGIEHYPSWIKNDLNREYVPSVISTATESKDKGVKNEREKKITTIVLNDKEYRFSFSEHSFDTPDGEWNTHGLLELYFEDKKILAINASLEHSTYDSTWSPFGIEAFIDGDWIADFVALKELKEQSERERAIQTAEDPRKVEEMKKNFGID